MIKRMIRVPRSTLGVGATALFGLVSCAGFEDEPSPDPGQLAQASAATVGNARQPAYEPDEVLVRFKTGITRKALAAVHTRHQADVVHEYRVPSNLQLVKLPSGTTVESALESYRGDPEVLYAEPNYIYQLDVTPDDSSFGTMYGLNNVGQTGGLPDADINAPEAWDVTTGSNSVVIGVLDTGVDYTHEDLTANMFINPGEIAGNGLDDDANGWVDDIHGISAVFETGDPMDNNGHGTHVSGTIAARGNNGIGVVGVSWNATIVGCKAFNPSGALDDILQCIDYFLLLKTRPNNPVDIVATNNSWGGGPFSQALLDAILAHREAGILFVAAAGNSATNTDLTPHFPSSYEAENIISVLATTHNDTRASFSNFGALTVDVGAPGESILSTLLGDTYGLLSGTSMATPHVTGLVGLLKAQNPSRTAQQLKNLVLTGGTPAAGTIGTSLTGRRIRAEGSVNCVDQTLVKRLAPTPTSVFVGVGTPVPLAMLAITCDSASPEPQIVTVIETGATIDLIDDDASGRFEGSFTPTELGTTTLSFPNGDVVTVTAAASYEPARVVDFEFPVIEGTVLPIACDFCSASLESPFPIRFAGADPGFTTLHVISKGVLSFNAPVFFGFDNQPLPTTASPTFIVPFWDDLFTGSAGASVRFEVLGSAPERQLVIEYRNVRHFFFNGTVTFQVVFFENSPDIRYNYADVVFGSPTFDNGASQTVGVQVMPGLAQQFSFNTPGAVTNNLSLLFTMGAPIAAAGADQVVLPLAQVQLDGSASADPNGTVESFAWTQVTGTPVLLQGADTATPTFTAPAEAGTLTFRLEVTDNDGNTGSDTVNVIVNLPPVADPGDDFEIGTNLLGTLDGTASVDPDGVLVGFQWTQVHGDPVVINNASTALATFLSPPTAQFLVFQLTVTDEHGFTDSDLVVVDVFLNLVPVAAAGQDRIVRPGATVTLDGSNSNDPDGTITSFAWTAPVCFTTEGACNVTLVGADTATPQFVAPGASGVVVLNLTVTDDAGATASDLITVGVFLQAPNAVITAATSCVQGGSTITLDGSHSLDADGDIVSFAWTQLAGPPVTLDGATSSIASFTAPSQGTLVFSLTIVDGDGLVDTAEVTIPIDPPPVAQALASAQVVVAGTTVTLDGSQSVDAASFFWRQIAGTTAILSSSNVASPTFVARNPAAPFEIVTFELTVTDGCGATSTDTVSIVVVRT